MLYFHLDNAKYKESLVKIERKVYVLPLYKYLLESSLTNNLNETVFLV